VKTITMDFDIYQAELAQERLAGAKLKEELLAKIKNILEYTHGYSSTKEINKARAELYAVLEELK